MGTKVSAEAKLKAAVVDRLISSGIVDDNAVLVSELTIDNWAHRTDIVLANGRLWGFELKSERDSLSRLPSQLEAFSKHFEKLVIVVAEKFEKQAEKLVLKFSGVGLWVACDKGNLTEKIRPRAKTMRPEAYISLMTVPELRKLLSSNGLKCSNISRRAELVEFANLLPSDLLADGARTAIKDRFREVHQRFLSLREESGSLSAISALRRKAGGTSPTFEPPKTIDLSRYPSIPLDHPNLINAPSGPVIARSRR